MPVLQSNGYEPWVFSTRLRAGDDWKKEIDDAITSSAALILIITRASVNSHYVTYEWAFALGLGIKVIPLLLEGVQLHPKLADLQWLEYQKAKNENWAGLISLITTASDSDTTFVNSLEREINGSNPYLRAVALSRLSAIRSEQATELLCKLTNHALPDIWKTAARELGKRQAPCAAEALTRLLEESGQWEDLELLVAVNAMAAVKYFHLLEEVTVDDAIELLDKAIPSAREEVLSLMRTWSNSANSVLQGRVSLNMLDRYDKEHIHTYLNRLLVKSAKESVREDALRIIRREWCNFDEAQKTLTLEAMVMAIRNHSETTAAQVAELFCSLGIPNTLSYVEEWKQQLFERENWNVRSIDRHQLSLKGFYYARDFYYWRAVGFLAVMGNMDARRKLRKLILKMMFPWWRVALSPFVRLNMESLDHYAMKVTRGDFGPSIQGFHTHLFGKCSRGSKR